MEEFEKSARMEYMGDNMYRVVWATVNVTMEEEIEYVGPVAPTKDLAKQAGLERLNMFIEKLQNHDMELPELETDEDDDGNIILVDDGTLDIPLEIPLSIDADDVLLSVGWYFGTRSDNYDAMYDEAAKELIEYRVLTEEL